MTRNNELIIDIVIEFDVGTDIDDSVVTSFRHKQSGKDLDFGVVGMWLCDLEDEVEFPKECGKYVANAEWDESSSVIVGLYDIQKLNTERKYGINLWQILEGRGRKEMCLSKSWYLYAVDLDKTGCGWAEVKLARKSEDGLFLFAHTVLGNIRYGDLM